MPLFSQHTRPPRGASPHSAAPRPAMPGRAAATRRAPAPQPAPGATASALLKRYRPIETRATGGFGSVEVCLDARLQRRVAIKRIPLAAPFEVASNDARADALAEARTASLLQHPNIVTVIDFTYDSAYAYLVMEYVDGMSLEEFLATVDGNSLTYDECACIADALAQALSYAHENGVLHLDIKPANVLIDRSGHVKLADFGMATLTSAAGFGGARGGTIGYMPPEQLRGDAVDERSDVFALAAVLYESLCATAPFRAGTPADSLKRIDKGVIVPSSLLPDIPENSEEALLCALSPEPSERMASIADFSDWFLPHLGDAREGRKSLARMIEKLTADDEGDSGETEATGQRRVWELDPAEGYLGSRTPRARALATSAIGGVGTAMCCALILITLGLDIQASVLAAIAIGAAGGIAPQIGSALVATGFLMMIMSTTNLIAVLPAAAVLCAIFIGWCTRGAARLERPRQRSCASWRSAPPRATPSCSQARWRLLRDISCPQCPPPSAARSELPSADGSTSRSRTAGRSRAPPLSLRSPMRSSSRGSRSSLRPLRQRAPRSPDTPATCAIRAAVACSALPARSRELWLFCCSVLQTLWKLPAWTLHRLPRFSGRELYPL